VRPRYEVWRSFVSRDAQQMVLSDDHLTGDSKSLSQTLHALVRKQAKRRRCFSYLLPIQ